MSNYTKVTDFAAKDSLLTGDPNKIIKGADFDAEFNSIQTAIATKADGNNPSITNGVINSTTIGATSPSTIVGTSVTSTLGFTGNLTGNVTGDLTGNVTAATGTTSLNDLTVGGSVTGTLNTADLNITGNITVSGTVDGRDVATDGAKLDGIEAGATGDQTAAEIKTAYESNADTNALTDAEKTLLGTIETGADVTDATNVDAAGAVMNSDATTASMSFVIDEDSFTSNLDTKVPTQQSVKAYVDATVIAIGGVTVSPTPSASEYARWTSGSELEGRTVSEVRADLSLEVGTDVQAWDADLDTIAALTPTDGHFLQYSGGTWAGAEVITDPTLATLTQTLASNEQATLTLSSTVTSAPVVSVTKEVPQTGTTNNYWDVSSTNENYTRVDHAPATTLSIPLFDVQNASYLSSFSVSGQDTAPREVKFNNDGTKMYVLGGTGTDVNEYTLSTAFDATTASYSQNFSVSSQETIPYGMTFNNDGTKMYVVGNNAESVLEYTLSTGFDVSTASYSQGFSVSSQETAPSAIAFNTDGTKMFVVGPVSDNVNEYTLSTAFDVSTASYSQNFSVATEDTSPYGLEFSNDGKQMFMAGLANDIVAVYSLSTAFDVSTASYVGNFSVASQETAPHGLAFNDRGSKMYIIGTSGDSVFQYELPLVLELGTGSFASADVGKTIEANDGVFVLAGTDGSYFEATTPTSYDQVASGSWSMYSIVYNSTDDDLELSVYGETFNTFYSSYSQSFSVTTQESAPAGLAFSASGSKMFVVGSIGDDVNEYTLSTPFDVSTASFVDSFSVAGQETLPAGVTFNTDGTKMFVTGDTGNDVNEYTLSTGFDVSTATFVDSFSVSTKETAPKGVVFNTDGTKMFVCGTSSDSVHEYSLTTGFDVSTATFSQTLSVSAEVPNTYGLAFNNDGTKLYVVGNGGASRVAEYVLTTGFDISTASHLQSTTISEDSTASDVKFNADGTKFYILGGVTDAVYEYDIDNTTPSGYHAAVTTNSTDSTYWTDINSMTVDEDAGDGNVYYAVSTDDRTTWSVVDDTDGVRDIVRNNAGTWEYNSNGTYSLETWTAGTTNTELATLEEAMDGSIGVDPFGVYWVSYASNSFSIASEEVNPLGIEFNSDGTKMFIVGSNGDDVNEYTLSTAYDVSTASFVDSFSVTGQTTAPRLLAFNPDGTKMYTNGSTTIYQYTLSTGFDVSTASYASKSYVAQSGGTEDMVFNSDGTKMFIANNGFVRIDEHSLSTAYDISTASFVDSFDLSGQAADPRGVDFSTDGLRMFVTDITDDVIYEYELSSAFDVSTATYFATSSSLASQDSSPIALTFSADGTQLFILGSTNDTVYEYSAGRASYPNQMGKTQLEAVTDANHFTLGNDLDLAIVFNKTAVGTAPSSDGVSINYDANTLEQGAVLGTDYNWDNPASDKVRITALQAGNYKVRVV